MSEQKNTHGGRREGSGRKPKEETVTTGFRVHKESLEIIREHKFPINAEVNKLVKKIAKTLKKDERSFAESK